MLYSQTQSRDLFQRTSWCYLSRRGCPACRHSAAVWFFFGTAGRVRYPAGHTGTHCRSRSRTPRWKTAPLLPGRPLHWEKGCPAPNTHCQCLQKEKRKFGLIAGEYVLTVGACRKCLTRSYYFHLKMTELVNTWLSSSPSSCVVIWVVEESPPTPLSQTVVVPARRDVRFSSCQ